MACLLGGLSVMMQIASEMLGNSLFSVHYVLENQPLNLEISRFPSLPLVLSLLVILEWLLGG